MSFTKIDLIKRLADANNNEIIGDEDFLNDLKNEFIEYWLAKTDQELIEYYAVKANMVVKKIGFDEFIFDYNVDTKSTNRFVYYKEFDA